MAYRLDSAGVYSDVIDSAIDTLNANSKGLDGAPQQTANGLYRCVELLAVIGLELDSSGKYREFIMQVLEDMDTNNKSLAFLSARLIHFSECFSQVE